MAYTSAANVRELGLQKREFYTGLAGTDITFPDNHTESIISISKNGAGTTATFIPPYTARLSQAAITSDYFSITRAVYMSDTEISNTITEAEAVIDGMLAKSYTLPFAAAHPMLVTMSRKLSRAMCMMKLSTSAEFNIHPAELEQARIDRKEVLEVLDKIVNNEMEIIDSSGVVVARMENYKDVGIYVGIDDSTEEV